MYAARYTVSYNEKEEPPTRAVRLEVEPSSDNIVTISDLIPCTNYTFQVAAVSVSGFRGPYSERDAGTLEIGMWARESWSLCH